MNRFLGRFTNAVRSPWQMYPIGLLFGLGFDTATEVALLFLAGGAAERGLPFYAILCLPILFAAGMSLLDTIDGSFMNFAYGWAFSKPVRKVFYNITITGLSVAVALIIGTVELARTARLAAGPARRVLELVREININMLGFVIVGDVRRDLGDRAVGLALRAHRGALDRAPRRSLTRHAGRVRHAPDAPARMGGDRHRRRAPRGPMLHLGTAVASLVLAASSSHHHRHPLIALVLLVVIVGGVVYYFLRRRRLARERENAQR